jgi:hypothetical protein
MGKAAPAERKPAAKAAKADAGEKKAAASAAGKPSKKAAAAGGDGDGGGGGGLVGDEGGRTYLHGPRGGVAHTCSLTAVRWAGPHSGAPGLFAQDEPPVQRQYVRVEH